MFSCPLAMTDGAAFTLRHLKREFNNPKKVSNKIKKHSKIQNKNNSSKNIN